MKEEELDMERLCAEMAAIDALHKSKKDECLSIVKAEVSKCKYAEILEEIEESGDTYDYQLTDKPIGEYYELKHNDCLKGIYIDQTIGGGYHGDTFAGTVSIEYASGKFLQFIYSM